MVLTNKPQKKAKTRDESIEDLRLWRGQLGRYIADEAYESVSIDDLRRALSVIPGSMAASVIAERDER